VVLPRFAAELLRVRREFATPNENDAVFATRNGTWHQVVNIERRWRQIRKTPALSGCPPHVPQDCGDADLGGHNVRARLAPARPLLEPGHSDHYIAKPPVSADLSELLERLAESDDASSDS
jgi:hypothetical protein